VLPPIVEPISDRIACSGANGPIVDVTFNNQSSTSVDVYWIDWSCKLVLYIPKLAAGKSTVLSTYVNHAWLVRRSSDQQHLFCFKAISSATVTVTDTPQNYC
jgi:hypothetical protein